MKLIFSLIFLITWIASYSQDIKVTGKILDATNAEPLPGTTIQIKNTLNSGTVSDINGSYSLDVSRGDTLVFSFVGFKNQELVVNSPGEYNMELSPDITALDVVVVTGYTTQSKKSITGAITGIDGDQLKKVATTDITQVLQGRVSGVTISGQGGPGASQVVRIRGFGSLGDNDPLYVIDGVQTKSGLNQINPADIESINILKDPSTSALYGSRGANGVIVITTKRGRSGKPTISYNGFVGIQYVPKNRFPDVLTPQQLANVVWEGERNALGFDGTFNHPIYLDGPSPIIPDYIIPLPINTPSGIDPEDYQYVTGNKFRYTKTNKSGTDWFDVIFDPALLQSHQIGVSGGTDNSNYNVTFNYTNENGVIVETNFKRYSLRVNTEFEPKDWLRVGESFTSSYSTSHSFASQSRQGPVVNAYLMPEIFPVYDVGGHLTGPNGLSGIFEVNNPLFGLKNGSQNFNQTVRILGVSYVEMEPFEDLTFRTQIGLNFGTNHYNFYLPINAEASLASSTGSLTEASSFDTEWRWLNKIGYSKSFNKHSLTGFVAIESSAYNSRFILGEANGYLFNNPDYRYLSAGPNFVRVQGTGSKNTLYSIFGSLQYNYADKYYLSGVLRRDGSSKFGRNNRFGIFPSVGASWIVSEERMLTGSSWVDQLKLRASWGKVGNEAISPSQTISRFGSNPQFTNYDINGTNSTTTPGITATSLGNANLKWETNETLDFGLDFKTFNQRIQVIFDWYKRDTRDLLYAPPSSATTNGGILPSVQNVLSFVNKGVDIELKYFSKTTSDFTFDIGANISTYRNRVTKLAPGLDFIHGASVLNTRIGRHVVGKPLGQFYGFVQEGIYQSAGDVTGALIAEANPNQPENLVGHFKYRNIDTTEVDGRQIINNEDRTFIGNPHPDFTYGVSFNASYKKFEFGLLIQGVYGGDIFNWFRAQTDFPNGGTTNYSSRVLDSWSPENKGASLPIIQRGNTYSDNRVSSFFVEDGTYVRLKNIQLGYNFNVDGFTSLKVYIQGQNLLTLTNYSGLDPEVSSGNPNTIGVDFGNNYPIAHKVLLGISASF